MVDYIFYAFLLTVFIVIIIAIINIYFMKQTDSMQCLSSHNGLVYYDPYNRRACEGNEEIQPERSVMGLPLRI